MIVFDEYGPVRMIRTGEWKYVHRYPKGPRELYDMVNDRFEADDLSDEDPTLLAELTTTIDEIASSEGGSWLDVSDCS